MGVEIERKFLVVGDAWRAEVLRSVVMDQGYLNDAAAVRDGRQNASVRVRLEGEDARLNIKSRELGMRRQEFDYPIPMVDAQALLALCVAGRISKTRHYVAHCGFTWEIDEFAGDNAGLVVAEVELEDEAQALAIPAWAGTEVTHLPRYYNLMLAERPFVTWSQAERDTQER